MGESNKSDYDYSLLMWENITLKPFSSACLSTIKPTQKGWNYKIFFSRICYECQWKPWQRRVNQKNTNVSCNIWGRTFNNSRGLLIHLKACTIMAIIFWDFLMFYQIFFHHKWNESWLLVINMEYTSCRTSCRTI